MSEPIPTEPSQDVLKVLGITGGMLALVSAVVTLTAAFTARPTQEEVQQMLDRQQIQQSAIWEARSLLTQQRLDRIEQRIEVR